MSSPTMPRRSGSIQRGAPCWRPSSSRGGTSQLYAESLADVGDLAEEIGNAQGGYYDVSKLIATVGKKWIGVPWTVGAD